MDQTAQKQVPHLDGRGHRSTLAQLDLSQRSFPVVVDVDVLTEDGSRRDPPVLRQRLQSQNHVLRDVTMETKRDRSVSNSGRRLSGHCPAFKGRLYKTFSAEVISFISESKIKK